MPQVTLHDPQTGDPADATEMANNNRQLQGLLNGGLDNANFSASAALAISKLAGYPSDGAKFVCGDNSWKALSALVVPSVRVGSMTTQSIPDNAADYTVYSEWDDLLWDTDSCFHLAAPDRLTCHTTGLYMITAEVQWSSNGNSLRRMAIRNQAGVYLALSERLPGNATGYQEHSLGTLWRLTQDDYVQLCLWQNSGSATNVTVNSWYSPVFAMTLVGP